MESGSGPFRCEVQAGMHKPNSPASANVLIRGDQVLCGRCDYCLVGHFPHKCPECGVPPILPQTATLGLAQRIAPVFYSLSLGVCVGVLVLAMGRDAYRYSFVPVSPYRFTLIAACANALLCIIAIRRQHARCWVHSPLLGVFAAVISIVAIICV